MIIADVHDAVCAVDDIETCNVEITLTLVPYDKMSEEAFDDAWSMGMTFISSKMTNVLSVSIQICRGMSR